MSGLTLRFLIPILLIMLGVQICATLMAIPLVTTGQTAFGDPQAIENPFIYLGYVIIVTAIFLLLFKFGLGKFISWFFYFTTWAITYFVTSMIVYQFWGTSNVLADLIAFILPIIAVILIWKYPEWYIIDTVGFIDCVGVTALVGVSFGIIPLIILLIIFALYDFISVYKTRHMLTLAESVLTSKLPALFIIPKNPGFSYVNSEKAWENLDDKESRQAYIIGMGDIILPSTMVISASVFLNGTKVWGLFTLPALGAMIGSLIGLVALQWYATKNPKSHAGLPFLNSFTLVGFGIMYGISYLTGF
jgi:presenilin-like A22 family membrane protease